MRLHSLVNIPTTTAPSQGDVPGANAPTFVTMQSIVTFPVAAFVVGTLWQTAKVLAPGAADSLLVAFGIALGVGAVVYAITVTDEQAQLSTTRKLIGIPIAFVNSVFLFTSAVGGVALTE